jgi:hypothetical protein
LIVADRSLKAFEDGVFDVCNCSLKNIIGLSYSSFLSSSSCMDFSSFMDFSLSFIDFFSSHRVHRFLLSSILCLNLRIPTSLLSISLWSDLGDFFNSSLFSYSLCCFNGSLY